MKEELTLKEKIFSVPDKWKKNAYIDTKKYREMWKRSIDDPDGFWGDIAGEYISWFKKWDKVCEYDWDKSPEHKWFLNGKLNHSTNLQNN